MMQMGDYKKAGEYYKESINNMMKNLRQDSNESSINQTLLANERSQNKFLLSTRYYMKGMAAIERIREAYPLRLVLENKTTELTSKKRTVNPLTKS